MEGHGKKYPFKRVLVTGGAGSIGIQVCKELASRGIDVRLFDLPEQVTRTERHVPRGATIFHGSVLDCSSLRDAMAGCDAVIHLAAYLGVRRTETNRLRCLEVNINGTQNVLDCAVQHCLKKIVFASSSEVYGEPLENPISETTPTQGKTVYAVTKLAGEELCKAYGQRYPDLKFSILRYFNAYGPFQIAQFVIPKFINAVLENRAPVIYGTGDQMRSYCHVSDIGRATVDALLSSAANSEVFNIGNSANPVSLSDLAKLVIRIAAPTGKADKLRPKYERKFEKTDRSKDREVFARYCDTSKAEQTLGFKARVSLEEGIRQVIAQGVLFPAWATSDLQYTLDESLESAVIQAKESET